MSGDVDGVFTAIDAANRADPNRLNGEPLALAQGRAASKWLAELVPDAGSELRLAVRAHHLRRWEIARTDFVAGRDGYLRWRRENKAHQADSLAALMTAANWPIESIERARTLLSRTRLRNDAETQALEDAACLVFLETQFEAMTARVDRDHLVSVIAKTLKKMSPQAVSLAGSINLSSTTQAVVEQAVATLAPQETS